MAALPFGRPDGRPAQRPDAPARPSLAVVQRRRRWPAVILAATCVLVFGGLLGAAVFHTQLAERQLRIDRLERSVTVERERFADLRHERAELRSPAYLDTVADELAMTRGQTSRFVHVTPAMLAQQIAAAGAVEDQPSKIVVEPDPLDQFRDVKSVSDGQP